MKISIETDNTLNENEICIHVKKVTEYVSRLIGKISADEGETEKTEVPEVGKMIVGHRGETVSFIKPENIVRIYSLQKKVYAECISDSSEDGDYELALRLYQIEERMNDENSGFKKFIRISNTDIVNFEFLKNMDMSINGNIVMNLTNGERIFVSRRYMKDIKIKLGIK